MPDSEAVSFLSLLIDLYLGIVEINLLVGQRRLNQERQISQSTGAVPELGVGNQFRRVLISRTSGMGKLIIFRNLRRFFSCLTHWGKSSHANKIKAITPPDEVKE